MIIRKQILSGNPYSVVNDVISYMYPVINQGNVSLNGPIAVVDDKIGTISNCIVTSVMPGDSATCTSFYTVLAQDLNVGSVINNAYATTNVNGVTAVSDTAQATAIASQNPSIRLYKFGAFNTNGTVHYTFSVTNNGNVTLYNISVDDPMLTNITCSADSLLAGTTMMCNADPYQPTAIDTAAGYIENTATVEHRP